MPHLIDVKQKMSSWVSAVLTMCLMAISLQAFAVDISQQDLQQIRTRLVRAGLRQADVKLDAHGRVELVGQYEDRKEVQKAFSIAQSVVGVNYVAPTTPENVNYPVPREEWTVLMQQAASIPKVETSGSVRVQRRFALVVGVSKFKLKGIDLEFPAKDAADFYYFLTNSAGFPREDAVLLVDRGATRANVEAQLDRIQRQAGPDDQVVVYISSHGAPPNDLGNMNIIMHDTVSSPREQVFYTSLSDERIHAFIAALKDSKVLFVLDTCFSGAAFSHVPGFTANGSKAASSEDRRATAGLSLKRLNFFATGQSPQQQKPKTYAGKGSKILISASDENEKSWESSALRNGYFTYYLLQGMRKTYEIHSAFDIAKPLVASSVRRDTRVSQNPQGHFLPENAQMEFRPVVSN